MHICHVRSFCIMHALCHIMRQSRDSPFAPDLDSLHLPSFPPSHLPTFPTFPPSHLPTFPPSHLPTFASHASGTVSTDTRQYGSAASGCRLSGSLRTRISAGQAFVWYDCMYARIRVCAYVCVSCVSCVSCVLCQHAHSFPSSTVTFLLLL